MLALKLCESKSNLIFENTSMGLKLSILSSSGQSSLKVTGEGANVEIQQARDDPWHVNMETQGSPRVSPWRAWVEVATASKRAKELPDEQLRDLIGKW